jgi:hypothetical protein
MAETLTQVRQAPERCLQCPAFNRVLLVREAANGGADLATALQPMGSTCWRPAVRWPKSMNLITNSFCGIPICLRPKKRPRSANCFGNARDCRSLF